MKTGVKKHISVREILNDAVCNISRQESIVYKNKMDYLRELCRLSRKTFSVFLGVLNNQDMLAKEKAECTAFLLALAKHTEEQIALIERGGWLEDVQLADDK